jgi:hypothetical protein
MNDDEWIAFRGAADLLGGYAPVLRALRLSKIKSQGLALDGTDHEDISAMQWSEWSFLPTFRGPVSEQRRAQGWLVPPGTEIRRIGHGFREIRLLRADVERLAEPPAIKPALPAGMGGNAHKRQSVGAAIEPEPQDTEQSPPRPPKLRMDQHLAAKLLELFPHGPPPNMRVSEMCARIREARNKGLGSFTERSLIRARALAWPQLKKVSRD